MPTLPSIATFYKCFLLASSTHPPWPRIELVVDDGPERAVAMSNKIVVSCSPKTCPS